LRVHLSQHPTLSSSLNNPAALEISCYKKLCGGIYAKEEVGISKPGIISHVGLEIEISLSDV
jgi:hypothetical protein